MTTPEALRARQLKIGIVLILLAVFTVVQSVYFSVEDRAQRDCVEEKFAELSSALETRSKLVETERVATRKVILVYADAIATAQREGRHVTPQADPDLRDQMISALLEYRTATEDIRRKLSSNPLPPYPVGVCQQ